MQAVAEKIVESLRVTTESQQQFISLSGFITGSQLTGEYGTLQQNQPLKYDNFIALWQGTTIPYGQQPLAVVPPQTDSPEGGFLFQDVDITINSYIVGYGTGQRLGDSQSIAATLMFPKAHGGDPTLFSTKISLNSFTSNSVIINYMTPIGNQPNTNRNWVGIWEGANVPFDGSNNLGWSWVGSSGNTGNAAIGGITLRRGTIYTIAYATDPSWSGIAATVTFQTS